MTISLPLMSGTSTSAAPAVIGGESTSASVHLTVPNVAPAVTIKQAEDALFGYLQGMRALGRTKIDVNEAARALGLPVAIVLTAAHALRPKGVEVA